MQLKIQGNKKIVSMLSRLIKFGIVGLSGVAVNCCTLFICKEYIFETINVNGFDLSLNISIFFAMSLSIINNFTFNYLWTWKDRVIHNKKFSVLTVKFSKYLFASSGAILIQFIGINTLVKMNFNYIVASLITIAIGSLINFLINNYWTFKK